VDDLRQPLLRHDERPGQVDQRARRCLDDHHGALGRDSPRRVRLRSQPRHQPEGEQPQDDVPALRCGPDCDDTLLHRSGQNPDRPGGNPAVHRPPVRRAALGQGAGREGLSGHSPPSHHRLRRDRPDRLARAGQGRARRAAGLGLGLLRCLCLHVCARVAHNRLPHLGGVLVRSGQRCRQRGSGGP